MRDGSKINTACFVRKFPWFLRNLVFRIGISETSRARYISATFYPRTHIYQTMLLFLFKKKLRETFTLLPIFGPLIYFYTEGNNSLNDFRYSQARQKKNQT